MRKPILIVGAGISGISLAFYLDQLNIPFLIIDSGVNHSSKLAAGIINPIVFRRMALSWRIDDLLPEALSFYRALEQQLQKKLMYSITIRRAFAHQQEKYLWLKKQEEQAYQAYLFPLNKDDEEFSLLKNKCGTGRVKNAYWVDAKSLISEGQKHLEKKNFLRYETFDYNEVNCETSQYKDISFDKLIFCEGYHGLKNPWFNYLPLQATKGETITLKSEEMPENESFNYKCFALPVGKHHFKVGATYNWDSPNVDLTVEAREELTNHLTNLVDFPFEFVKQEAGVRPTVLDRRPLLGVHPENLNIYIYNGLGAKGYLITPKLAQEFVSYLEGKSILDKEIDIKRYANRFKEGN